MFRFEPLKSVISRTIAGDALWRIVTADQRLVRAIPIELEQALPEIGNSVGASDSAWLTLHFWIDDRPKPRLGLFWRTTSVRNRDTRNSVLEALLENGGSGFVYRGTKGAWREKDEPAFSGGTVSSAWWPSGNEPDLLAAEHQIRGELEQWIQRVPEMLRALANIGCVISTTKRTSQESPDKGARSTAKYVSPTVAASPVPVSSRSTQSTIKLTPPLPDWIRDDVFQPHYTNIHELLTHPKLTPAQHAENTRRLYGTETMEGFNDWDATVLLLAKDAGPMQTFLRLIEQGDPQPWRHADHRDSKGTPTNERLRRLASIIPGTKLYGSVMAGLLRNDGRQRGALPNFGDSKLQSYLRRVLTDVVFPNMKNLQAIICLGNEACEVVGAIIDQPRLAFQFDTLRRAAEPVDYKGKHVFAAWHPVASQSAEDVQRVLTAAARVCTQPSK